MKKGVRTAIIILLALVFLGSAGGLIHYGLESWERAQANREAQNMVEPTEKPTPTPIPEPTPTPTEEPTPSQDPNIDAALEHIDLAELKAVNDDVVAWISIPDTPISYPVLQGTDNDYYLNHTWKGEYNSGGSIFMEWQNSSDFSDFNTLIYGHRMSDSSMFNSLRHYKDASYLAQHPKIYMTMENEVRVYDIFAACQVTVTDPVYWLITTQDSFKQPMIDFCLENSVVDAGIIPDKSSRLITLSTCVNMSVSDYRWVVVAVETQIIPRTE